MAHLEKCLMCDGSGEILSDSKSEVCRCFGRGWVTVEEPNGWTGTDQVAVYKPLIESHPSDC